MILIDKPYVSDFLEKTLETLKIPVIATDAAKSLLTNKKLTFINEADAISLLKEKKAKLYTNSENAIAWIKQNVQFSSLPSKIDLFKNKVLFRNLLKEIYPDYYYKSVGIDKLKAVDINELPFPLILKPAIGFFSMGVYQINTSIEWLDTINKIKSEIIQHKDIYPEEVMDISEFIIEEYIEGEEYAVDCYFNSNGKPVVLGILHHIFSSGKDVSDRVYTTSKQIIETNLLPIEKFLTKVGQLADLTDFPVHVEVRIDKQGNIIPIEINPMRFGGWCTTADLAWRAYGINSYEYFFSNKEPLWNEILKNKNNLYSIIVLDNNSGLAAQEIENFDFHKLKLDFEKVLEVREIDYNKYPVFGFLFTETQENNIEELNKILTSDLRKYITTKAKD